MNRIFVGVVISFIWGQPCANSMLQLMLSMCIFIFIKKNYCQICCHTTHNCTKMNEKWICKQNKRLIQIKLNMCFRQFMHGMIIIVLFVNIRFQWHRNAQNLRKHKFKQTVQNKKKETKSTNKNHRLQWNAESKYTMQIIRHSNRCSIIFTRTTHYYLRKVHRATKTAIRWTKSPWALSMNHNRIRIRV